MAEMKTADEAFKKKIEETYRTRTSEERVRINRERTDHFARVEAGARIALQAEERTKRAIERLPANMRNMSVSEHQERMRTPQGRTELLRATLKETRERESGERSLAKEGRGSAHARDGESVKEKLQRQIREIRDTGRAPRS